MQCFATRKGKARLCHALRSSESSCSIMSANGDVQGRLLVCVFQLVLAQSLSELSQAQVER